MDKSKNKYGINRESIARFRRIMDEIYEVTEKEMLSKGHGCPILWDGIHNVIDSPFSKDGIAILDKKMCEYKYKGEEVLAPTSYYMCQDTKQEFTTRALDKINLDIIKFIYESQVNSKTLTTVTKTVE